LTSATSGETETPTGANDGEVSVIEFVANYIVLRKRFERVDGTWAHPGYQVYDARRIVDTEWNKFFGGGKA
jgi:hypothetical protein